MNDKNNLSRGKSIKVINQVNRDAFCENDENETPEMEDLESETTRVTLKTDNHSRNRLMALVNLGHSNSIGELVEQLVKEKAESLSESEYERFKYLYYTFERQDIKKQNNKK